ncbi:MAG TPA: AMP-binding protein [Candidatus Sulfotelmatobacter sp.]|nr:AMP-binding protein [Candidatus Sulfotelmatobacter sp.]
MAESIAEFFLEHFRAHAHECAYVQRRGYRTERVTYGQVLQQTFGFAQELERRSLAKGDRVMLWGENSAEWAAVFFGCALRGVVVVPMDDGASVDFARRVCGQVGAKLVVASGRRREEVGDLSVPILGLEELPRSCHDSATSGGGEMPGRDDVLQIVFTSGTTADPKGVVITHGNVMANIDPLEKEIRAYLSYERFVHPVRFLNLLPLSHVFGQFLGMFLPPLMGGTVIFQNELKPSEVMNTIRRERVSVLVSVPRVLQSLKHKIERDIEGGGQSEKFRQRFVGAKGKHFLRRWWIFRAIRRQFGWKFLAFISGGAALDSDTEEFWGRSGYAVIQGYGLTETTSLISVNHPFRLGKGSIGKVLPGREVKLAEDGEILVRGGGVASGYWNSKGSHGVSDEQGWYRTGDIGALDAAGNLYFKGRKKEVIVTPGGTNVHPGDLEAALLRQPEVKDCVVVGVERDGNAEACSVVILRDGGDLESVVRRANESLAEYQRMRMWTEWPQEDFPRTNTQKPKRQAIAEFVQARMEQAGSASSGQGGSSPLAELISRVAGRSVPNLRSEVSLDSDLGLSSLDRVELLSALEDRYQVDLSETRFSSVRTVGDVERMLRGDATPAGAYHYPGWVLRWPARWVRLLAHYLLMRPAIVLLGWPRILGRENLRGVKGPLLVVSNHLGDVDPGFILTALPARFRHGLAIATGGETLEALRSPSSDRNWFLRVYDRVQWILGVSLLNLFPLPREAGFRRSFAYAGEAVDRGYSILVFPEGRHTTDGKLHPFRTGVGLLAENLGIPVLPMRIDGLFEYKKAGKKFAPPWKISVRIGNPVKFSEGMNAAAIAAELQERVAAL